MRQPSRCGEQADAALAQAIDALLPQTQCTRCGYPDCRHYAEAVARGEADINRCPPGGRYTIARLSELTGGTPRALDPDCGEAALRRLAVIDEAWCIGCTLCIQACPVDAIIGAAKRMHAVMIDRCTGCELCLPPCPMDCIRMQPSRHLPSDPALWLTDQAALARRRYLERADRLSQRSAARKPAGRPTAGEDRQRRQAQVADAVARVRAKRAQRGSNGH